MSLTPPNQRKASNVRRPDGITRSDELLLEAEKKAERRERNKQNGFQPVDWSKVDPEHPSEALVAQFSNLLAAKRWAKIPPLRLNERLDEETTRNYIRHVWGKHAAIASREPTRRETLPAYALPPTKEDIDARAQEYLSLFREQLPHYKAGLRELARIELRMERLNEAIDNITPLDEDDLKRRKLLSEEWATCVARGQEIQKALGITKSQRDASGQNETQWTMYQRDQKKAAGWMRERMTKVTCACGAIVAWVLPSFGEVHDPLPWKIAVKCACGRTTTHLFNPKKGSERGEA